MTSLAVAEPVDEESKLGLDESFEVHASMLDDPYHAARGLDAKARLNSKFMDAGKALMTGVRARRSMSPKPSGPPRTRNAGGQQFEMVSSDRVELLAGGTDNPTNRHRQDGLRSAKLPSRFSGGDDGKRLGLDRGKTVPLYTADDLSFATRPNKNVSIKHSIIGSALNKSSQHWTATGVAMNSHVNFAPSKEATIKVNAFKDSKLVRASTMLTDDLIDRIKNDAYMRSSYMSVCWYCATLCLVLACIFFQWETWSSQKQELYSILTNEVFSIETNTMNYDGSLKDVVSSKADIYYWLETTLDGIFTTNTCGDDDCVAPEEYPYFKANSDAREFSGCKSDCGSIPTTSVVVDFFDPWKLQAAYDAITDAQSSGFNYGSGIYSASRFGMADSTPVAGWNVCSRTDSQYGYFTEVCMFDGDVFIDNLPYRTYELADGSDGFGGSLEMGLYNGEWEVRIAFEDFTWPGVNSGDGMVPIAFPAVRGQVCTWNTGSEECETWNPCPAAENCTCEWWRDGVYTCWDEHEVGNWSDVFLDYVVEENLVNLAQYGLNDSSYSNKYDNRSAIINADDDQWDTWKPCTNGRFHRLVLMWFNFDDDGGWNGQTLTISNEDREALFHYTMESGYMVVEDQIYLCPDLAYYVSVSSGTSNWYYTGFYIVDEEEQGSLIDYATFLTGENFSTIVYGTGTVTYCKFLGSAGKGVDCSRAYDDDFFYGDYYYDDGKRRLQSEEELQEAQQEAAWLEGEGIVERSPGLVKWSSPEKGALRVSIPDQHRNETEIHLRATRQWNQIQTKGQSAPPSFSPAPKLEVRQRELSGNTSSPTAAPTPQPTVSSAPTPSPTISPVPSVTSTPTTLAPSVSPVPTPGPSYTWSQQPSLWSGWNYWYVSQRQILPFSTSTTTCSASSSGDGTCDSSNNNMACGFDGGDCCVATCEAGDDDGFACDRNQMDCKSPESYKYWPYFDSNENTRYPFNTRAAFADILYAVDGEVTMSSLPSLTCADCDAYNSSYLSIPFKVKADSSSHSMFPDLNATRFREVSRGNRLLGGVLVTQQRRDTAQCTDLSSADQSEYDDMCLGSASTDHFGMDPTFVSSSDLYRETNKWADFYDSDEIHKSGLPYAFFEDQGCVDTETGESCDEGTVRHYPVIFDVDLNVTRKDEFFTVLKDGNYIDDQTALIRFDFPIVNYRSGLLIIFTVTFRPQMTGGYSMTLDIDIFRADFDPNWYVYIVLNSMWAAFVGMLCAFEIAELLGSIQEFNHPFQYVFSLANVIDWTNYIVQLLAVATSIKYYYHVRQFSYQAHYATAVDFQATARLPQCTSEMGKLQDMLEHLGGLVDLRSRQSKFMIVNLLLTTMTLVKNLDFHPKMGLISRTLKGAFVDLAFFMMLFMAIITIFAFLGCVLFMNFSDGFSNINNSLLSCLGMVVQTYDPTDDIDSAEQYTGALMFYWTFQVVTFFVLLNALLAIIVESYDKIKARSAAQEQQDPVWIWLHTSWSQIESDKLALKDCDIPPSELVEIMDDFANYAKRRRLRPGQKYQVQVDGQGPWIDCELIEMNTDGDWLLETMELADGFDTFRICQPDCNLRVHAKYYMEMRVRALYWEKIKGLALDSLTTDTRFYMINKDESDSDSGIVLLDQTSVVLALQCLVPTMHIKMLYALSLNLLVKYGVDADLNRDGVVSQGEWAAVQGAIHEMSGLRGKGGTIDITQQARLVVQMLEEVGASERSVG